MLPSFFHNKLVIVILILVVLAGAWYVTSSSSSSGDTAISSQNAAGGDTSVLQSLLTLRAIKLQGGILSNPAFATLRDFSVQLVSEPVGRTNPFAPLDGTSAIVAPAARDITIHSNTATATPPVVIPNPILKGFKR